MTTKNVSQYCQMSPGGGSPQSSLAENHCFQIGTVLQKPCVQGHHLHSGNITWLNEWYSNQKKKIIYQQIVSVCVCTYITCVYIDSQRPGDWDLLILWNVSVSYTLKHIKYLTCELHFWVIWRAQVEIILKGHEIGSIYACHSEGPNAN